MSGPMIARAIVAMHAMPRTSSMAPEEPLQPVVCRIRVVIFEEANEACRAPQLPSSASSPSWARSAVMEAKWL